MLPPPETDNVKKYGICSGAPREKISLAGYMNGGEIVHRPGLVNIGRKWLVQLTGFEVLVVAKYVYP